MKRVLVMAFALFGCVRPEPRVPAPAADSLARQVLCADIGDAACHEACPAAEREVDCLLELRLGEDPDALARARALYASTGVLVGIDARASIEGHGGEEVPMFPALPVGEHRHHLEWLHASLVAFEAFVDGLSAHASHPVAFEPRPKAFVFFRTNGTAYPSAYCTEDVIGYNVHGPLHEHARDMHETLFHELFHFNDVNADAWSGRVLEPLFESILERCGEDDACLGPYAPHPSRVEGGTYYAFEGRDVREYAAELGLRYFLEHEKLLVGDPPLPPFKCATDTNAVAWTQMVETWFGGVDLSGPCLEDSNE